MNSVRKTAGTPLEPRPGAAHAAAPPSRAGRVTVHHFRLWDAQRGYFIVAPLKGAEKRIKQLNGQIVPGTAEEVDARLIDAQGRYRPPGPR